MKMRSYFRLSTVAIWCALLAPLSVQAAWPERPITIVVPQEAGGGADVLGREVAMRLKSVLGQSVVIENKPGAAGIIGVDYVARARPDGYTFVLGSNSTHGINQSLYKKLPYQVLKDFVPVVKIAEAPLLVVLNPEVPINSIAELIQKAKEEPGKLTYGSAGTGNSTHLAGELFQHMTGTTLMHVPFKGATQSEVSVIGHQVDMMFSSIMTAMPHVKEGNMKALAVTSGKRSSLAPELPTVDEAAGISGFEVSPWYALFAPAETSPDVVVGMHDAVAKVLKDPELKKKFISLGAEVGDMSQPEFAEFVQAEVKKWAKVVKDADINID